MRCAGVAVLVVALTGSALTFPAPAAAQEIVITISKAQQRAAIAVDGAERFRWPVSTGRRGYDTPVGKFRLVRLERDWYSRKYQMAPMPHSIFFYKGYAMHGTLEEKTLGRRASHGCVRLSRENAATLFAMVRARGGRNARIVVVNGPLPALRDPSDATMAAIEQADDPAAALAKADDNDTIQVTVTPGATPVARPAPARQVRPAPAQKFTSAGSEAEVLRGREAWLRSLDRKYGIVR